ncbi:Hypothetical protein LCAKO_0973 [Lacticaseibacillus paracasei subsp. paracasei]|uniref:Uncharacterized protein n=1 Tax=Lacticaseibacillus paracasei subsp. paracasei TaxID=47714 RepID=A0AAP9HGM0_LACPA|nr:hypothetical protein [Lacticaseibacillus paracasei]QGV17510.1 Hypothetical protein LCAKO_0973 [Lacticaseibacillus paracasei subsp. paracasei]
MLRVLKRLKEHFLGKKGTDKITVTIDANTDPLMAKLDKIKNAVENIKADATPEVSPTLTAYGLCDAKLPEIEGVEIQSFIAELYKALNDYQQKQEQSSRHASTPHVRIDIDNIHDIPRVWIDGERVDDLHGDKKPALSRLYVNWRAGDGADMQSGKHEFVIQHYEQDGYNVPKEIKTGERSITDKDD